LFVNKRNRFLFTNFNFIYFSDKTSNFGSWCATSFAGYRSEECRLWKRFKTSVSAEPSTGCTPDMSNFWQKLPPNAGTEEPIQLTSYKLHESTTLNR